MQNLDDLSDLLQYDTPSVTNVVATYPAKPDVCLGLYDPWDIDWYTDDTLHCLYPELGRTAGYALTCVFGLPTPGVNRLSFLDVLKAADAMPKPVILVIKNGFPDRIKRKCAVCGGNMSTAMVKAGIRGVIADAPTRDVDEVRGMGIQFLVTGAVAGHGDFAIKAVNVPVSVAGMDVAPGEIIHMDENGAVKFPAIHLEEVKKRLAALHETEERRMSRMKNAPDMETVLRIMSGFEEA